MNPHYKRISKQKSKLIHLDESQCVKDCRCENISPNIYDINNMVNYLQNIQKEESCISLTIIKHIFMSLDRDMLISISITIEKILQLLISKYLSNGEKLFKVMCIINILDQKNYNLIDWAYSYFQDIHLQKAKFNQFQKYKILEFYVRHSLISSNNITSFFDVSEDCEILIMESYMSSYKNIQHDCIQIFLNYLFTQSFAFKSYGWNCDFIKFLVFCIFNGFKFYRFNEEINILIELYWECNDPIIYDSISIIIAHLSKVPLCGLQHCNE